MKPRTELGRFLDHRGITQEWLSKKTKISRNTISKIASDDQYSPNMGTIKKIMAAIREVDENKKAEDFWSM
ncbi:helix-turn-helix transcriptional regulator [Sutcliffiella horikoshii]|uniref:helix-turn-helix domain-containing protein n=1 Tax=Sutcliffiella horikoshii TaxID=79883 RepID=UPI00384B08B9